MTSVMFDVNGSCHPSLLQRIVRKGVGVKERGEMALNIIKSVTVVLFLELIS